MRNTRRASDAHTPSPPDTLSTRKAAAVMCAGTHMQRVCNDVQSVCVCAMHDVLQVVALDRRLQAVQKPEARQDLHGLAQRLRAVALDELQLTQPTLFGEKNKFTSKTGL